MRLWFFLKKELLQLLQAPEALFMMVLFPIALTGVLGMALSNVVNGFVNLPEVEVSLIAEGESDLYTQEADSAGLRFQKITYDEAKKAFDAGDLDHVAWLKSDGLELWTSSESSLEFLILESYSNAFVDQANMALYSLEKGRPEVLGFQESFTETKAIDTKNSPSSFGYYGVTMLTLIMMYGSMQAADVLTTERAHGTILRLQSSPFPMTNIFIVKVLATLITLTLQVSLVILVNTLIFDVNYGSIANIVGLLASYGLFTCALGVLVSQLVRRVETTNVVLTVITNLFLALGGAYFPVKGSAILERMVEFSPVGWINQALFRSIYQPGMESPVTIILRFVLLSVIMIAIAGIVFLKRGTQHVSDY